MTSSVPKKRLDVLLYERGLAKSRQNARSLIMTGNILVNDVPIDKPGTFVSEDTVIINRAPAASFVSRGGIKLAHAIEDLGLQINGYVCLDVGASTGGFTDCLLQKGAGRVYAVDVGYGQMDWKLRQDPKVVVIERTNIRNVTTETLPEPFDLITIDVSFISLTIVIPVVYRFLKPVGKILALIKPQFEVGKGQVGKGGVVKDTGMHQSVIRDLSNAFESIGLVAKAVVPSPILGPKGNKEFVLYLGRDPAKYLENQ